MTELPQGLSYAALGAVSLAACGWFFWFAIQRFNKRSQAEGDIDERLPKILDTALTPWKEAVAMQKSIIDEERKEKQRAQDERESMTKQFIEYATVQTQQHASEMSKIREQFADGQRRLYERVEQAEKHHAACTLKLEEAERRICQLEERQFNTAITSN